MESFIKYIKTHKLLIAYIILFILILVAALVIYNYLFSVKGDNYGSRLKDISKYQISETDQNKIKKELESIEGIKKSTFDLRGKLIYIVLDVNKGVSKDTSKGFSSKVLEQLSDNEKSYYDIQLMIDCSECDAEDNTYPVIGYKNNTRENFSWSNN